MKLKGFKLFLIFILYSLFVSGQNSVSGYIYSKESNLPINSAVIYKDKSTILSQSNKEGFFSFHTIENQINIVVYAPNYREKKIILNIKNDTLLKIELSYMKFNLAEVSIYDKIREGETSNLKDVEHLNIYAAKKTDVLNLENIVGNLATNNARQIFSKIPNLNIYENDESGLQLNIGSRGLDPNRIAHFNTKQNGYNISADALGYPESYYTPPMEALREIQIIRGAASLQHGTQFGGVLNFVFNKPSQFKKLELTNRNSVGSKGLYTNFSSISGTKNKFSYYSFFNFKRGNGFRPNSDFNLKNFFTYFNYKFSKKLSVSSEITYMDYLAHQPGGLTDQMFYDNPLQSNRERNWFSVNWLLWNIKIDYKISQKQQCELSFFGLKASRFALGFRTNRADQIDPLSARDLIKGDFKNIGGEFKYLNKYKLFNKNSVLLLGYKLYRAKNKSEQGPGNDMSDPFFEFDYENHPFYQNQSSYLFPNFNFSFFGENVFYLNEKLSFTPGFRFEYIKTESDGYYKQINTDAAGNVILDEIILNNEIRKRSFFLLGLGVAYKPNNKVEVYSNISENYRSITFSDISIINPTFSINPGIADESGFTSDIGFRGRIPSLLQYDFTLFSVFYNNRIGYILKELPDGSVKTELNNVGNAFMYGFESLIDIKIADVITENKKFNVSFFINNSITNSQYIKNEENGIQGNEVEFVPKLNIKSGVNIRYNNIQARFQYTYVSEQYTDATNAIESNLSGTIGQIPDYNVCDLSIELNFNKIKLESGVNNIFDSSYFTRRATGYPGPGIIPAPRRSFYVTLEFKI